MSLILMLSVVVCSVSLLGVTRLRMRPVQAAASSRR
ncbi:hypothetical protein Rsw2DRAFT_2196 [Rhodobacter ferrooxidans]|uniref:Uncharacterized protein n=1 Tax=Rhodobacter ferrooxidans TaxID=371731 RepID=C8S2B8_9RHOB|nr:hypothetical protein Rsw2DRAFT_2196 [Rhodobacter sp. SW2]